MPKTNLDLYSNAEQTARLIMAAPNALASDETILETFTTAQGDPADYAVWKGWVEDRKNFYTNLSRQPAPSVVAANKATQAAALAAKTAPAATPAA